MQCTSAYPCPPEKVGLNVIDQLRKRYKCAVGFSDHTVGVAAGYAAAALGASVIEKHLTFSKLMYGSDAANGTEPDEFSTYCRGIQEIWKMNETPVDKDLLEDLESMRLVFQKSIVAARTINSGHVLSREDLAYKKPGNGIPAKFFRSFLGKELRHPVSENQQIRFEDLI